MTELTPEAERNLRGNIENGFSLPPDVARVLLAALDAERARNRELSESFQAAVEGDNNLIAGQNARIARLEAVAEAAREVMALPGYKDVVANTATDRLRAALAVLEKPQGKQDPFGGQATSAAPSITAAEPCAGEAVGQGRPGLAADRNADAPASTVLEEPPT